jgi:glycosyltransferase involved in cell wall biosynthesis
MSQNTALMSHLNAINQFMITVILVNHGGKRDISKAIESLENQTCKDFELVIESGDGTLGDNFNKGLARSRGEWIKLLADDDYLPRNSIDLYMKNLSDCGWIMGDVVNYSDTDERKHELGLYKSVFYNTKCLIAENTIHGGSCLYRKDLVERLGGFNEELITGEEYEFNIRMSLLTTPRKFSGLVYCYQIHSGNKGVLHKDFESREKRKQYIKEKIQNEALYFN